ncbi:DNA mismatch repair endonuclease MutL [Waterburya agarophytonicola K14]|uniref:DNA mismatch repair protein MutL n=1 Tax=Waterburya agarophytonicola KI4 TaxID=2874699 RepID=A0A964BUY7_9CYAN|nr:DNA mismatch repair endonuclease MutL [Waterburya agarophytonicola KI4]
MPSKIQTLPDEVIDLIAAGEVIDSLAAVVRELVENALDAGATRIAIALDLESWQVQVSDNGRGMSLEDLRICIQPHSTSKIRTCQDLWHITSLGFRGEALHSIVQVADLTICSRTKAGLEPVGWKVSYQEGKAIEESAIAIASGTIVTVSNLFARIPVRRRGLPSLPRQLKAIQKLIHQIALCHPQTTWQIKQNNNSWFNISPGTTARDILPQFLRNVNSSDFEYVKREIATPSDDDVVASTIELIIGLPDRCHRHRADWVKVSVNNRLVRSPELEQTILNSMAKTLPRDRYPICFLHLHTCPSQIDWNRHPAKTEIYLHSLPYWQAEVDKAISIALKLNNHHLPDGVGDRRIGKILKVAESSGKYQIDRDLAGDLAQKPLPTFQNNPLKLKAVAQVSKTYIVAEHSSGVWLVEQHIAHERILYEQLQDCWDLVALSTPITLEYLRPKQVEQLQNLEIDIELFGDNIWAVRTAPKALAQRNDCAAALIELSWGGDLRSAQVATACRSAIRNGTVLDLLQMQNLLDLWLATRNPRTCPHGRPIYLSLEESSLSRFFRRHWVIGKSHGI